MIKLLRTVLASAMSAFRTRRDLALENLALRQQLAPFKQTGRRPRLSDADRAFWVLLSRIWAPWRDVLLRPPSECRPGGLACGSLPVSPLRCEAVRDEDAIGAWNAPSVGRRPGGKLLYSDLAIITALTLRADGAYDTRAIYEALAGVAGSRATIVVPPRKTASPSKPSEDLLAQRDAAIARIADVGRRQWRKEAGAHQQAKGENGMYRDKQLIGDGLRAKKPDAQTREAKFAVGVLNRMMELGMPKSVKIVA